VAENNRLGVHEKIGQLAQDQGQMRAWRWFALSWLHDECDAEDAVQNALVTVIRLAPDNIDVDGLVRYTTACVKNASRALKRQNRRRAVSAGVEFENIAADIPTQEELVLYAQQLERLGAAVATLAEPQRRLLAFFRTGLSGAEIAAHFGVQPATARKRLQRVREVLRRELVDDHNDKTSSGD
jgi:RNA polymerase sigma factor (sigma-70 family)